MLKLGDALPSVRTHDAHRWRSVQDSLGRMRVAATELGGRALNIDWLPAAAVKYHISADINDYVINEIPIVAVDLPNRNLDEFGYDEMASFNEQQGRLTYQTFIGKPTHEEHANTDCTKAKGVHFDAQMEQDPETGLWRIIVLAGWDRTKDHKLATDILEGRRTGFCLAEGTLVSTSRGLVPIEQLGNGSRVVQEPVPVQFQVMTPNGVGQAVYWYYSGKKKSYDLFLSNDMTVSGSSNQMVLVLGTDMSTSWVELKDVQPGMYVATDTQSATPELWPTSCALPAMPEAKAPEVTRTPNLTCAMCGASVKQLARHVQMGHKITTQQYAERYYYTGPWTSFVARTSVSKTATFPTEMTTDLAVVLGYLVSEGNATWLKDTYNTGFSSSSVEMLDEYEASFFRCFGRTSTRTQGLGEIGSVRSIINGNPVIQRKLFYRTYCYSRTIGEFLISVAGDGVGGTAYDKVLPWAVMQAPKECVAAFLRTLFLGDGAGFFRNPEENLERVMYYSMSDELLSQLQVLLTKFGITSSRGPKHDIVIVGLNNVATFMRDIMGNDCLDLTERRLRHDIIPHVRGLLAIDRHDDVGRDNRYVDSRTWLSTDAGAAALLRLDDSTRARVSSVLAMQCRWHEVVDVSITDDVDMYDLTVNGPSGPLEDPSSFSANGIFCHNSMGAFVDYTRCSHPECAATSATGHIACSHHKNGSAKGSITNDGYLVYERCAGVNYIETSAVGDPAQYDAHQRWKEAYGAGRRAASTNWLPSRRGL